MARKPTYEELELRIEALEKEAVSGADRAKVSGINIRWNPNEGSCTFEELPVAMMWVDTTLAGLPVEVHTQTFEYKDRLAILSTVRDITDRKLAEEEKMRLEEQLQQAQKMEAIGTLAGGIAHDFNNMLGIILGNAELALDDVPERNPAHYNLEEVRTASIRAKDVVK